MVKNHDSGDVRGLEDVFRSQEFTRMSGGGATGPGGAVMPGSRDDTLFKKMFGHTHAVTDLRHADDAGPDVAQPQRTLSTSDLDASSTSGRRLETNPGGGDGAGAEEGATGPLDPWKRESGRYWAIAAVSALVALVVAGITAGNGQHGPLHISAQGRQHGTARPQHGSHGSHGSGGDATGPTSPGSLTGALGSGALLLGLSSTGAPGSATGPGGHVTLIGAATTTGTPFPSSSTSSGGSTGGAGGIPPGLGGSDPISPVAAGVGSTVDTVGTSVTGLANQIGSAVPTAAPTASAVNGVVNTLDQAVSATTL